MMIAHIKGILTFTSPTFVVIETGGVGYKIFIPASTFHALPKIYEPFTLHTSFVVRENTQTLYGFLNLSERDFFEALLSVTGIGPKTALALIGHMPLRELAGAIASEDATSICRVPGIGKKGAERLIIEMRDKVGASFFALDGLDVNASSNKPSRLNDALHDALNALINLGYTQSTAQKALKKTLKETPETVDIGLLISTALKHV